MSNTEQNTNVVPAWWTAMYHETFDTPIDRVGMVIALSPSTVPEESVRGIFRYGLKQKLGDAHAPSTEKKFPDKTERELDAKKRVEACRDAIIAGNAFRGERAAVDPVVTAMRAIAALQRMGFDAATITGMVAGTVPLPTRAPPAETPAAAPIVSPEEVAETKRRNRATR